MPKELITYRLFYENLNITSKWKKEYNALTATQKNILLDALSNDSFDVADQKIQTILRFYKNSVINRTISLRYKKDRPVLPTSNSQRNALHPTFKNNTNFSILYQYLYQIII